MQPLNTFITFCQMAQVFVHMELFECALARERLQAPFFLMFENVSAKPDARNLTKRELSEVVTAGDFIFSPGNKFATDYNDKNDHLMRDEIAICRRAEWRLLGLRMGLVERMDMMNTTKKSVDVVRHI